MGCDPTTEKVLEGLLPFVDENREERAYRYVDDDTGRRFHIRDFSREREKDRYFLEEHKPIGFWSESQRSRVLERLYRKMKREMTPNRLVAAMQEEERSRESDVCVLYSGGGLGVGSIYYDSLEDCARAIARSLESDQFYRHIEIQEDRDKDLSEQLAELQDSLRYWEDVASDCEEEDVGIFRGAHTMGGAPLSPETKQAILAYLNAPDESLWNRSRPARSRARAPYGGRGSRKIRRRPKRSTKAANGRAFPNLMC